MAMMPPVCRTVALPRRRAAGPSEGGDMKAFAVILALSIGFPNGSAKSIERAEAHLDCLGLYALLKMAAPTFANLAEERMDRVRQSYFRDLPFPSPVPMPLTSGEMEEQASARMRARGARLADTVSEEDVTRETDAFLADIHACDARYGLAPTPTPWRD